MKKYLIFILAIIGIAACKRKEPAPNYCYSASDHPDIREKFTVNGVDSVFTKIEAYRSHGDLTDTFINIGFDYVNKNCQVLFKMSLIRINKYQFGKQIVLMPYTCDQRIPGACNSIGYFSLIDFDTSYETFEPLEGTDPSQNWLEITSIDSVRIKGNYYVTFLRNQYYTVPSSFMNADTLHITGSFDVANPG